MPNEPALPASRAVPAAGVVGGVLAVLSAAVLWGTTGAAQALGGAHDPLAVGAARLALGGGALVVVALATGGRGALARCLRRPLVRWTALAALATAVYQGAFFWAVADTGVATGSLVTLGTVPLATGACAAVLFREAPTRRWAAGTALAVAGCAALVLGGSADGAVVRPAGVAAAVLAGACYAVYTAALKVLLDRGVPVVAAVSATTGLGGALLLPVLAARGASLAGVDAALAVAWLGLVTTAGGYLLFARGLRRVPAATVGTLSLAEPVAATALGVVLLGERPGAAAALGGVAVLAGLLLAARRPTPPVPAPPVPAPPVPAAPVPAPPLPAALAPPHDPITEGAPA